MRTLLDRLRAAVEAFRDPSKTDGLRGVMGFEVTRDQMNDVVEANLAEAFRQFDAPDDAAEATGVIDPDVSGDVADAVVEELPHVPDDAKVARVVLDAPNEVRVYYHTDPNRADPDEWGMTRKEFFEAMNEAARRQGRGGAL